MFKRFLTSDEGGSGGQVDGGQGGATAVADSAPAGGAPVDDGRAVGGWIDDPSDSPDAGDGGDNAPPASDEWDGEDELAADVEALGLPLESLRSGKVTPKQLRYAIGNLVNQVRAGMGGQAQPKAESQPAKPKYPEWPKDLKFTFPEGSDPELVAMGKNFQSVYDNLTQRLAAFEERFGEIDGLRSSMESAERATRQREFDGLLKNYVKANPAFEALIGKGTTAALRRSNPKAFAARKDIADRIDFEMSRGADMDDAIERAIAATFTNHNRSIARQEVRSQVDRRRQQATARPGTRNAGAVSEGDNPGLSVVEHFVKTGEVPKSR